MTTRVETGKKGKGEEEGKRARWRKKTGTHEVVPTEIAPPFPPHLLRYIKFIVSGLLPELLHPLLQED
jgi:hypothetical protein